MEFESFYAGELLHIGVQVGESAAVDSLLASLVQVERMLPLFWLHRQMRTQIVLQQSRKKQRQLIPHPAATAETAVQTTASPVVSSAI